MSISDVEKALLRSGFVPPSTLHTGVTRSLATNNITVHPQEHSEQLSSPQLPPVVDEPQLPSKTGSINATETDQPEFEVDWGDDNDTENPRNWSLWYKSLTIGFVSWSTWVVVVYSTSYTTGIAEMMKDFNVSSEPVVTLGITTYLAGVAAGSVILAPLSEMYGRRPVYMISMLVFVLLIIPCGLATSLTEILVVRFFAAFAGSAMIANAPGTVSDIVDDEYRALAFSIWSIGPFNGPTFGPIIGGFSTQYLGWRWTNWIVMIISGVAWVFVVILKETYSPALLRKKAKVRRLETGDVRFWSRYDDQTASFLQLLKLNLSRPFMMIFTEPICVFWNIYIGIIYGILYLCFVAYPIVFTELRRWSPGFSGLAFTGLAIGCFIIIGAEPLFRRMINAHTLDPANRKLPTEAMVSVVCIAAVLVPLGELWFAWTCAPPVHWIWPVLAGIPFGAGNTAVFIYACNYLAECYGVYAASALAGNTIIRSFVGGTLPLAGAIMYRKLSPRWAGTVLGLVQIAIIPIPVVFYKYGGRIRMRSKLVAAMQRDNDRTIGRRARLLAVGETDRAGTQGAEEGKPIPVRV